MYDLQQQHCYHLNDHLYAPKVLFSGIFIDTDFNIDYALMGDYDLLDVNHCPHSERPVSANSCSRRRRKRK